jgi:alkaline phosphatase D
MSNLLVGHVTTNTARIWVRGDKNKRMAELSYRKTGEAAWKTETASLDDTRGYVAVFDLNDLTENSSYECSLAFKSGGAPTVKTGGFRTAPAGPRDVSFLLASCNWTRAPLDILDPEKAWAGIESLAGSLAPAFMLHCGDQIYSDVPLSPLPEFMNVGYYRSLYQKAWKIKPTARVLASMPHYMILDDHEIFDDYYTGKSYANLSDTQAIRGAALTAYKEYQHSHNPQPFPLPALHFAWSWAGVEFFALDVRTERHVRPDNQIVSDQQMGELKKWLKANAQATKFVVTSVPFVGEARNLRDKWNGPDFQAQRDEIIDFLAINPDIARVVFLTGDMHCSYHATMKIGRTNGATLVVHELMSSPINQFCNAFHSFVAAARRTTANGVPYEVGLDEREFYGKHSNVMLIKAATSGQVSWDIYRTKGVQTPPSPALVGTTFQL